MERFCVTRYFSNCGIIANTLLVQLEVQMALTIRDSPTVTTITNCKITGLIVWYVQRDFFARCRFVNHVGHVPVYVYNSPVRCTASCTYQTCFII